jgi:hypothetical protein
MLNSQFPSQHTRAERAAHEPVLLLSLSRILDGVMKLDDTVRKALDGAQSERHVAVPPGDQRNAFANEYRDDTDDEFVDRSFVEKRGDDLATTHHPDVLALAFPQALGERANRLGNEFNAGWD